MKIRLLSDLHCEGQRFTYEYAGEDVVVLAGDIHTQGRHSDVIDQIPRDLPIVLVAGNHEYYRGVFEEVKAALRKLETKYSNVRYLDNERFTLDGVEMFGGTMFTDFRSNGEVWKNVAVSSARDMINDFRVIDRIGEHYEHRPWTVDDHLIEHDKFTAALEGWLKVTEGAKRVVISHFVPTTQCVHPRFVGSALNPYFITDMEKYIGWDGLWLFGHTHDCYDQMLGDTRLVCNPRGYRNENPAFNPNLIVEI